MNSVVFYMYQPPIVAKFGEVFFEVYCILFIIFPSKNTSLKMVTTGGRNM